MEVFLEDNITVPKTDGVYERQMDGRTMERSPSFVRHSPSPLIHSDQKREERHEDKAKANKF